MIYPVTHPDAVFEHHYIINSECLMYFRLRFLGKWLGNRQIRCNWATKSASSSEEKQSYDTQNAVVLTNESSGSMGNFELVGPHYVGSLVKYDQRLLSRLLGAIGL